jgi:hypothetical protein
MPRPEPSRVRKLERIEAELRRRLARLSADAWQNRTLTKLFDAVRDKVHQAKGLREEESRKRRTA